jgi:hypothetical protein
MATERTFQDMLNEYLPNKVLRESFQKKDFFLSNCEKDDTWAGGTLVVPFRGAGASSVKFGGLTNSGDIGQSKYVRGEITSQPEVWGSLIFNERDLMEHGKLSEQNLLKILPDEIESFTDFIRMATSLSMTNGAHFATSSTNGNSSGELTIDRPERLEVGMKVYIDDDNSDPVAAYVSQVNMDTGLATFVSSRWGTTAVDLSNYTTAQNIKLYFDGHQTAANRLTSLKSALLSAANGGSSTLYGQTKLAYPYLQAINISGASISASNIIEKIFDAVIKLRNRGRGQADKVCMAYKHWGSVMKVLEGQKGAYRQASDVKAIQYGWEQVDIAGPKGKVTVVAIQEMDEDYIMILDMSAIKIYSNGFFKKRRGPSGNEYFEIRGEDGYAYVVDICFFGDIVLERPSRCAIIHSITAY